MIRLAERGLSEGAARLRRDEDRLFRTWETRARKRTGVRLVWDGAMASFADRPPRARLLFVLKEPNGPGDGSRLDLRDAPGWYGDADYRRYTWTTMARWASCLIDGEPLEDGVDAKEWIRQIARIAVVNLKKTPGASRTRDGEVRRFLDDPYNSGMLRRQLGLYRPHVTLCGGDSVGTHVARLYDRSDADWRQAKLGDQDDDISFTGIPELGTVISFWHPAQRRRKAAELCRMLIEARREIVGRAAGR